MARSRRGSKNGMAGKLLLRHGRDSLRFRKINPTEDAMLLRPCGYRAGKLRKRALGGHRRNRDTGRATDSKMQNHRKSPVVGEVQYGFCWHGWESKNVIWTVQALGAAAHFLSINGRDCRCLGLPPVFHEAIRPVDGKEGIFRVRSDRANPIRLHQLNSPTEISTVKEA
jgi:hypothetical protein